MMHYYLIQRKWTIHILPSENRDGGIYIHNTAKDNTAKDRYTPKSWRADRVHSKRAITITRLFKYIGNFTTKKENIQIKNADIFHISSQNKDCGYSLEPPRRVGSNEYSQSMFFEQK